MDLPALDVSYEWTHTIRGLCVWLIPHSLILFRISFMLWHAIGTLFLSMAEEHSAEPPGGSGDKRIHLQGRRPGLRLWVEKIYWRRKWLPIPIFLPGECYIDRGAWGVSVHGVAESGPTKHRQQSVCGDVMFFFLLLFPLQI